MSKSTNSMKGAAALFIGAVAASVVSFTSASAMTSGSCSFVFTRALRQGSTGAEVMNLQKVLNMSAATAVATSGAGSAGNETMTFGPATRAAVIKYQAANGISPTSGLVGPLTRAKLNTVCTGTGTTTGGTTTGGTTTSGPVSVMNGASVNTVLVDDSVGAILGSFVFSGNGTVTNVQLQRTGVSTDSTLRNVYLYDGATRLTDSASVVTNTGMINFNNPSGLFTVGGTRTITVRADIGDGIANSQSTNGQIVGVKLNTITTMGNSAQTVSGVMTNGLAIATVSNIATVGFTPSNYTPLTPSVNAGVLNQTLWSRTANIGQRSVLVRGITFKYVGSAPTDSVANIGLFIDGTRVGTGSINSNNRVVFDMTNSPLTLQTGNRLVELRGDVVKGSFRSFQFSIENSADVLMEDSSLSGVFVNVTASQQALGDSYSISAGNLTINQDPNFTVTKVIGGAGNVEISKFKVQAYGEDVKVETLSITPVLTGSTPSAAGLQNVALFVNDAAVGSSQNWTSGALTFNLGSSFIVPAGTSVILSVKADTKTTGGVNYTAGTLSADVTSGVARGQSSQNTVTVTGITGRLLTLSSANATFSKTGGFVATVSSPNTGMVKVGSYTITAGDAEDIVVTNLAVDLTTASGAVTTNFSSLKLGGNDSTSIFGQPTATGNNFSLNVTVPKSSSRVFDIYADAGTVASGGTLAVPATVTYRGAVTGISVTPAQVAGALITFNTATIGSGNITRLSSSPVSQLAVGGTTGSNIVTYTVKATGGTATIQELTFNIAASSSAVDRITSITVGGKTQAVTAATGNVVTGLNIMVPEGNTGVNIPVTVNFGTVRQPNGGVSADTAATTGIVLTAVKAISGSTIINTTGLTVASNQMQLVSSKPTLTVDSAQKTGLNIGAENKIGEVTIAADQGGDISINQIQFITGTSGMSTTTLSGARLADGNTTLPAFNGACTISGLTTTCVAAAGYTISAGTSKTFSLFANVAGTVSASATASVSSQVQTGAAFKWDDINANTGVSGALNGTNIYNFPTASYSIRQ